VSKLEELTPNAPVRGILPNGLATAVNVLWHGSAALELTTKTPEGKVAGRSAASRISASPAHGQAPS
jgi:hypothetical protein